MTTKVQSPKSKVQSRNPVSWGLESKVLRLPVSVRRRASAFTLIEMLVVIAIIAILAALIIPVTAAVKKAKMRRRAQTELNQIASMIELYKSKRNFYPPTFANTSVINPLYYELVGTRRTNDQTFTTLDNYTSINASDLGNWCKVQGLANATLGAGTPDEGVNAENFTKKTLNVGQILDYNDGGTNMVLLASQVEGPVMLPGPNGKKFNPIAYNSANPTNNPKSYDLWLDIQIGDKTERIYSSFTQ